MAASIGMQACLSTAGTAANLPQCLINTLQSVFCDGNWSSHLVKCTKKETVLITASQPGRLEGWLFTPDYSASECGYCVKAAVCENFQFEIKRKVQNHLIK